MQWRCPCVDDKILGLVSDVPVCWYRFTSYSHISDVLSFYKEELAEETPNYIDVKPWMMPSIYSKS
jgi:hypothetical protein